MAVPQTLSPADVQAFRAAICRAATGLFVARGYAGVTMRAIADAVGCSRMTPYRYFANKDEILAAVRAAALARVADMVDATVTNEPDPVTRLEALARAYLQFVRDDPNAYRLGFEFNEPYAVDYPELAAQVDRVRRPLLVAVRDCIDMGLLQGDAATIAHVFWAGMHGVISLHLSNKLMFGRDFDGLYRAMVRTLFRGVAAAPPDQPQAIPRPAPEETTS